MKYDYNYLKNNRVDYMKKHSESVGAYIKNKYKTDEEFREKKRAYQREYRKRKKEQLSNQLYIPESISNVSSS
jgi:hypothetical protein